MQQLWAMYRAHEEEVLEEYTRLAALQGVNIGENLSPEASTQSPGNKQQNLMKFGRPEEYANLSKKQKKELTAQMKGLHRALYEGSSFGKQGKKGRK